MPIFEFLKKKYHEPLLKIRVFKIKTSLCTENNRLEAPYQVRQSPGIGPISRSFHLNISCFIYVM